MEEETIPRQPVASGSKPRQRHRKVSHAAAPSEETVLAVAPPTVPAAVNGFSLDSALQPSLGESSKPATKPKRRSKPRTGADAEVRPARTNTVALPTSERKKKRKAAKLLAAENGVLPVVEKPSKSAPKPKVKTKKRNQHDTSERWPAIPISRNEVSRIPPLWSQDGKFYFTVSGTSIFVHSSHAPEFPRLSTLNSTHPSGHQKPITSIVLSPTNPSHLITSSLDGLLKFWDWKDGTLLRTVNLGREREEAELYHLCTGEVYNNWYVFATMSKLRDARKEQRNLAGDSAVARHYRVVAVPLIAPDAAEPNRYILVGRLSNPPSALFISPRHTYVVALASTKAYTFRLPTLPVPADSDTSTWHTTLVKFVSDHPLTCGAFAPDQSVSSKTPQGEEWFATGDRYGVIKLWHGLGAAFRQINGPENLTGQAREGEMRGVEKRLPTTQLHWHAHAVAAIAFTPSGAQLLSVGEESVLVQWHLASGKREYVPRLGGSPIVNLAVKAGSRGAEEEWWMGFSDGSAVRVGANSGTVSSVGQGIRVAQGRTPDMPYPLVLHPPTSSLVIPSSHPSTLQFVDPLASTVLFDLEVAPSNRVTRRDEQELQPVVVEKVAFSETADSKSRWMATMEGRQGDDAEGGRVKNLKIWEWEGNRYIINTQLPRPHGAEDVTSLVFSSPVASASVAGGAAMPYLLTSASDGSVKIWHIRAVKKAEEGMSEFPSHLISAFVAISVMTNQHIPSFFRSLWRWGVMFCNPDFFVFSVLHSSVSVTSLTRMSGKPSKKGPTYELYWTTRSSFTYRSMAVSDAAFSPDATIVALGHGVLISLWDVESNILLQTLDASVLGDVKRLGFIGNEGRHLVASGDKGLAAWDLLSCEVMWSQTLSSINHLVILGNTPNFVTVSPRPNGQSGSQLSIYTATSATPVRQIAVEQAIGRLCSVPSTNTGPGSLQFIISTPTYELFRIGDSTFQQPKPVSKDITKSVLPEKPTSIWQEMFGADAYLDGSAPTPNEDETRSALQARARATGRPSQVFEGPSHTLPPPSLLFDAFMEEMLAFKTDETRVEVVRADIGQQGILYDRREETDVIMPPDLVGELELGGGSRKVSDEEIRELEVFFKQVLSGQQKSVKSKALPIKINNDVSTPDRIVSKTVSTSNGISKNTSKDDKEQEEEEEETREVVSGDEAEDASAKKRGKKRRAPKGE
ncbi:hypothetical protein BCR39DRAFT_550862 [Naematelia encephala]|uniref:WD repeat-containing protein 75 second beta-propeller domain-containing protein n=1 Tax=Naematelia encephala TaxID=71784 RepID=A0A1Y2AJN8_9TREE|nr:hypothetical protein BCR39DRAFT_550862 [Naematelia encephala]